MHNSFSKSSICRVSTKPKKAPEFKVKILFSRSQKALKINIGVKKSGKIPKNCEADRENADVCDVGYY